MTFVVEEVDEATLAEAREWHAVSSAFHASGEVDAMSPAELRARQRSGVAPYRKPEFLPHARWTSVPGRGGDIPVRVLAPERPTGAYLYLHGGGLVVGGADLQDQRLWEYAQATGLCVLSVEYRLAPEHPYPAGPADAEDVAVWLLAEGHRQLGTPARFAIGGESAGAYLSALTLLRLRDRHGIGHGVAGVGGSSSRGSSSISRGSSSGDGFRAANLFFGAYDLTGTPSFRLTQGRGLLRSGGPTGPFWWYDQFLPGVDAEQRRSPDVSPLYADLNGMPPALFTVGAIDPLLDDSLFMHARWQAAGCDARLVVWPEAGHGLSSQPARIARRALGKAHAFLRDMVVTS